jgi:hypothetical protein
MEYGIGIGARTGIRPIIMHLITEAIELGYATSVRAFGPDKKPQFLEREVLAGCLSKAGS